MVNRWMGVVLLSAGVVIGAAVVGLWREPVVSAAVAPRLGTTALFQISAGGFSIAGQYVLVACKQ